MLNKKVKNKKPVRNLIKYLDLRKLKIRNRQKSH